MGVYKIQPKNCFYHYVISDYAHHLKWHAIQKNIYIFASTYWQWSTIDPTKSSTSPLFKNKYTVTFHNLYSDVPSQDKQHCCTRVYHNVYSNSPNNSPYAVTYYTIYSKGWYVSLSSWAFTGLPPPCGRLVPLMEGSFPDAVLSIDPDCRIVRHGLSSRNSNEWLSYASHCHYPCRLTAFLNHLFLLWAPPLAAVARTVIS